MNFWQVIPLLQQVWSVSLLVGVVVSFLVFKTSMETIIKLLTFSLAISFYRNLFLYSDLRLFTLIAHILPTKFFLFLLFSLFGFIVLCLDLDMMLKTRSGSSTKGGPPMTQRRQPPPRNVQGESPLHLRLWPSSPSPPQLHQRP